MKNPEEKLNEELSTSSQAEVKPSFFKSHYPLVIAGILLAGGGAFMGYSVGHDQGLTVVGFDADAQELATIVEEQKVNLDAANTALNTATQERDIAVQSAKQLNEVLSKAKEDKAHSDFLSQTYREKLKERGGLSLSVQNIAVKPLPSNAYEYVVDLVQVSPNNRRASGRVEIRLINREETLVIPLEKDQFNFDYYERLTGRWTMPSGFTPQFIEVHLKGSQIAIQRFAWQHGKETIESPAFISEIPQTEANAD